MPRLKPQLSTKYPRLLSFFSLPCKKLGLKWQNFTGDCIATHRIIFVSLLTASYSMHFWKVKAMCAGSFIPMS
uniref:Uncharacterized protein MANES_09G071900 n=1 Tax=Rhizophora mucronata TaxID=61149 RepID=A0A2P2K3G8_RHIMU